MIRRLTGDSEDLRQQLRDEILSTEAFHFKTFADSLDEIKEKGIVKILGSSHAVESAARKGLNDLVTFPVL